MSSQVYNPLGGGFLTVPPQPILSTRDPTVNDTVSPTGAPYQPFQGWRNVLTGSLFEYTSGGIWIVISNAGAGPITSVLGTANQIVATPSGSSVTLSLANPLTTPGPVTVTGNLTFAALGNKIIIPTGANAAAGTSGAMSGSPGAVTVATTASSTTALILYSRKTTGGTPGQVSITAQDGTGFTLTSTGNETSTFNWWIFNA